MQAGTSILRAGDADGVAVSFLPDHATGNRKAAGGDRLQRREPVEKEVPDKIGTRA